MSSLRGSLVRRQALPVALEESMYRLLRKSFVGATRAVFRQDLGDKHWVVLLQAGDGRVAGFSTLRFDTARVDGEWISVVSSGDTVIDPRHAGTSALSRTWIDAVRGLHRRHGRGRLYWLLISSGYRTYRFLPVFAREFYPRHDRPTPPSMRRLRDRLAGDRYGRLFDPATGIVRFDRPWKLRPALAAIAPERLEDPHVAFFARANPGHGHGDELVCITEIVDSNLTPAALRMARAGARRRSMQPSRTRAAP